MTQPSDTPLRLDHTFFDNESRPHLGSVLLRSKTLRPEQLDAALDEQRRTRKRLGEILIEWGLLYEQDISRALATQNDLSYLDIEMTGVDPRAAARLDPELGQRLCAIPARFLDDGSILVVVADPTDEGLLEVSAALNHQISYAVGDRTDVLEAWRRLLAGYR